MFPGLRDGIVVADMLGEFECVGIDFGLGALGEVVGWEGLGSCAEGFPVEVLGHCWRKASRSHFGRKLGPKRV